MKFDPSKAALLVIDMQKDFYADAGNAVLRGKSVDQMQDLPESINEFAALLREPWKYKGGGAGYSIHAELSTTGVHVIIGLTDVMFAKGMLVRTTSPEEIKGKRFSHE